MTRRPGPASAAASKLKVIDCDIHPAMTSWTEIHPTSRSAGSNIFRSTAAICGTPSPKRSPHPRMSPDAARTDAYPRRPAESSLALMPAATSRSQRDRDRNVDPAALESRKPNAISILEPRSRAMNTWQVENWVKREPRLRASVLVAQEDTLASVAEIDARRRSEFLAGLAAAAANRRAIGPTSVLADLRSSRARGPACHRACRPEPTAIPRPAAGWPSYYMEEHHSVAQAITGGRRELHLRRRFRTISSLASRRHHGGRPRLGPIPQRTHGQALGARLRSDAAVRQTAVRIRARARLVYDQPMEEPANATELLDLFDRIGWDRLRSSLPIIRTGISTIRAMPSGPRCPDG